MLSISTNWNSRRHETGEALLDEIAHLDVQLAYASRSLRGDVVDHVRLYGRRIHSCLRHDLLRGHGHGDLVGLLCDYCFLFVALVSGTAGQYEGQHAPC